MSCTVAARCILHARGVCGAARAAGRLDSHRCPRKGSRRGSSCRLLSTAGITGHRHRCGPQHHRTRMCHSTAFEPSAMRFKTSACCKQRNMLHMIMDQCALKHRCGRQVQLAVYHAQHTTVLQPVPTCDVVNHLGCCLGSEQLQGTGTQKKQGASESHAPSHPSKHTPRFPNATLSPHTCRHLLQDPALALSVKILNWLSSEMLK
jgi:hypothetical protein